MPAPMPLPMLFYEKLSCPACVGYGHSMVINNARGTMTCKHCGMSPREIGESVRSWLAENEAAADAELRKRGPSQDKPGTLRAVFDEEDARRLAVGGLGKIEHHDDGPAIGTGAMLRGAKFQEQAKPRVTADEALTAVQGLIKRKDDAYTERNRLVAALSRLYPSHLAVHDPNDAAWDPEWRTIVCVHIEIYEPIVSQSTATTPGRIVTSQATWHIHDSHRPLFLHLHFGPSHWDGHSTKEKYERLARLARPGL